MTWSTLVDGKVLCSMIVFPIGIVEKDMQEMTYIASYSMDSPLGM
jgi:hypothetical protein